MNPSMHTSFNPLNWRALGIVLLAHASILILFPASQQKAKPDESATIMLASLITPAPSPVVAIPEQPPQREIPKPVEPKPVVQIPEQPAILAARPSDHVPRFEQPIPSPEPQPVVQPKPAPIPEPIAVEPTPASLTKQPDTPMVNEIRAPEPTAATTTLTSSLSDFPP